MRRTLQGARLLITGASEGLGRNLAEQAARAGARVAVTARSADKLEELARNARAGGAEVLVIPGDVTREADRGRMLEEVAKEFGGLDVLINNAGLASFGHFISSREEILRQIMEVNFFAPAELIRRAIPMLSQGKQPAIVNIASMCGRRGMPAWTEYSASKFALCGLTEALRAEMVRFDIDVLLIVPGLIATEFRGHMLRNEGRMVIGLDKGVPVEKAAATILRSLIKNKTETVIGWDARWMVRANRLLPRLLDNLIARRIRRLYAS